MIDLQCGTSPGGKVFDVHLHAFLEVFNRVVDSGADFGAHRRTVVGAVVDPLQVRLQTVAEMDANGVTQGLLSGDERLVQEWMRRHPGRFFAAFHPDIKLDRDGHAAAAERFEREVEQGMWHAVGELGFVFQGRTLNDACLDPYFAVCERRRIPVFFHSGINGPEPYLILPKFRVELGDPLYLQDVVAKYPRMTIVIMHMGWPFFDHALYMLYAYSGIHLDTGFVDWMLGRSVFRRMLKEAVETVGSDRILFGTDQLVWPHMIGRAVRSIVEADFITAADRQRILWDNAARLFMDGGRF